MNSLLLSAIVIVWLVIAYRWYGRIIDRRVVQPDDANEPPACSESDGKIIGFGAMLTEGAVATLAIVCVAAGLRWTAPAGAPLSFFGVLGEGGPIKAYGVGSGAVTAPETVRPVSNRTQK
ncbi:MAG: carbon starvation CstA family protein [Candidatus Eisenbacteria bacterium]